LKDLDSLTASLRSAFGWLDANLTIGKCGGWP